MAEVLRGEVRDSLAHRDPVAQAGEPGIHASAAYPIDEGLLEVKGTSERGGEPDPGQEKAPFCCIKTPEARVAR